MQNACLQQEICINDPGKLPKALVVKLSLKKRTYVAGSMTGTITAVDASDKEKLRLTIDPSIRGGTLIEFSADRRKAKMVGGEYNYFLVCRTRL